MASYYKKTNMLCFESSELKSLFETRTKQEIIGEIGKRGYSSADVFLNKTKRDSLIKTVRVIKNKEEVEVFIAIYSLANFYGKEAKTCFFLKDGVNPLKDNIDSLKKLRGSLKENDITDFCLLRNSELRGFQLKTYRGSSDVLFSFIKEKLVHYANNIGDTNFLVLLRSGGNIEGNFFQKLHKDLKTLSIKGTGHILILYNEENKFSVIKTVYPTLGTTRIKLERIKLTK